MQVASKCCSICRETKTADNFNKSKSGRGGLQSRCIPCDRQYKRDHHDKHKDNPEYQLAKRERKLKYHYGITAEDYSVLLVKQSHRCAICSTHIEEELKNFPNRKYFHVDHCHSSGEVRGLLCQHCNLGLGLFKDNVEALKAAIKYLEPKET